MRGEVLHYDEAQGFGFISGADGNRYSFRREDLRRDAPMTKGTLVEFEPNNGQARGVFSIRAMTASVPSVGPGDPSPHAGSQQFGRYASAESPASTGLFSYAWRCMTANYATFRGRARRKEYWGFYLFWLLAFIVVCGVAATIDSMTATVYSDGQWIPIITIVASVIFVLAGFIPALAVTVRRIHDIGLSGWFYLLVFIPYIGGLIVFVFTLIPSQAHENKWGPVPEGIRIPAPYAPPAAPPAPPPTS